MDHATFATEAQRWKYAGAKEQHVREQFGESLARYYQRLNALLDSAAAEAAYPALVRRLRRLREQRHDARVPGSARAQRRMQGDGQASRS